MKRHLIIILCCLFPFLAMAQMRITGTVTDKKGDPLTGVILQVRSNNTNKMVGEKPLANCNGGGSRCTERGDSQGQQGA